MSNQKHEVDQENIVLKKQVDQLIQQHRLEMKELKMNLTKKHGEIERECDRLANRVEGIGTSPFFFFCRFLYFFFLNRVNFSSYKKKFGKELVSPTSIYLKHFILCNLFNMQ